ncbi:MAG TPA: hypothetical protein VFG18_03525 [Xanthomonadaceae bacterium]|jgi:hypothetical protein|nr:hypothetical protein [Xanthomonadaceae bacterium]
MRGSDTLFWRCGVLLNPAALALARRALAEAVPPAGVAAPVHDPAARAPGLDTAPAHAIMPACAAPTGCS